MTGRIIPLHGADHLEAGLLLPWHVTGRLEAVEAAQVEAHLAVCAECRETVRFEGRLGAEIAALPIDVEPGWTRLRRRLDLDRPRREGVLAGAWREGRRGLRAAWPWLGWALAAQIALILALAGVLAPGPRAGQGDRYHALGAATAAAAANAAVIFRPDTPERDLRSALEAGHARLVDGPTAAGAYVIRVPAARRAAVLATLRRRADVLLAEPIDSGGAP